MSDKNKKKVLSQTLENVRQGMEKADESYLGGLASDVTGIPFSKPTANATTVPKALLDKAVDKAGRFKPALGVLQENISKLNPENIPKNLYNQAAKYSPALQKAGSSASKFLKFAPPAEAAALAYRSAMLVNSEEERQKARDEAEEMYKRGGTVGGNLQNMGQGFLDPAGTIYAAGDALVDTVGTYAGLAYDKFFGPSEEEQIAAARDRTSKRRERLRLERMSPEQRAEREKRVAQAEIQSAQMKAQSNSRPVSGLFFNQPDSALAYRPAIRKIPKQKLERRIRGR